MMESCLQIASRHALACPTYNPRCVRILCGSQSNGRTGVPTTDGFIVRSDEERVPRSTDAFFCVRRACPELAEGVGCENAEGVGRENAAVDINRPYPQRKN